MKTSTVNISFQKDLLNEIDRWARSEFRTRSDLIREAARNYIERRKSWKKIFAFGGRQARRLDLRERDVSAAIATYRKRKRATH